MTDQSNPPQGRPQGMLLAATLAGLMLTMFLAALDSTIVGTALPRIVAELNGFEEYSWVATIYLVASTASTMVVSKLSDVYGRKPLLLFSVAGFIAGSVLCGFAQDMTQLIVFRGIQGVFGGGLFALVFSGIADLFTPLERGKWMGLFFGTFGLASVIGPFAGGIITETVSWRWAFWINLPVGVAAYIVLWKGYPAIRRGIADWRRIDFFGAITSTVATSSFLLALVWGGSSLQWFSPGVVISFGVAVVSFVLFIWIERRVPEPILPLDLFYNRTVASGSIIMFLAGFMMMSILLYAPLYAQAVMGDLPSQSGAILTPLMLTMVIGNTFVGRFLSHLGRYKPVMLAGCIILPGAIFLLTLLGASENRFLFLAGLMTFGLGISMWMPPINLAVQNAISRDRVGVVTGLTTYVRTMGQSLGSAITGSIVVASYTSGLPRLLPANAGSLSPELLERLTSPQSVLTPGASGAIPAGADITTVHAVQSAVHGALSAGIHNGYVAALVLSAIAAFTVIFLLPDKRLLGGKTTGEKPAGTRHLREEIREPVGMAG